ncbi:hypothetical protein C8J35_11636 [Rhizobium sp. PP-F2F-G38]|nr:hypothetical protein C8J35_11636 [Rhizobium sp. PP-F2F-G38]
MLWMLTEGLSWPGGLSDGRFNIYPLPGNEEDIAAHLERGFGVDDRERSCVETWADDGLADRPGPGGIGVRVFEASNSSVSDIDRSDEKYWAKVRSQPPVCCIELNRREQISGTAQRLARAYSNSG